MVYFGNSMVYFVKPMREFPKDLLRKYCHPVLDILQLMLRGEKSERTHIAQQRIWLIYKSQVLHYVKLN